jgi:hypothetical protein
MLQAVGFCSIRDSIILWNKIIAVYFKKKLIDLRILGILEILRIIPETQEEVAV